MPLFMITNSCDILQVSVEFLIVHVIIDEYLNIMAYFTRKLCFTPREWTKLLHKPHLLRAYSPATARQVRHANTGQFLAPSLLHEPFWVSGTRSCFKKN